VSSSPPVEFLPVNGHYFAAPRGISPEDARWIIGVNALLGEKVLTEEEEQRRRWREQRRKYLDRHRKKRYCIDCGADISGYPGRSKRCYDCRDTQVEEVRRRVKEREKAKRAEERTTDRGEV